MPRVVAMHLHNNAGRPTNGDPLRCRAGETYPLEAGGAIEIGPIVAEIARAPENFEIAEVALVDLAAQIQGRTKLNFHHIASMSRRDARRPLLVARQADGGLLLIDGRHRAARSKQLGYDTSEAWILTLEQWADWRG